VTIRHAHRKLFRPQPSAIWEDMYSSDAKTVKDLSAVLPRVGIPVLSDNLVVKAVNLLYEQVRSHTLVICRDS